MVELRIKFVSLVAHWSRHTVTIANEFIIRLQIIWQWKLSVKRDCEVWIKILLSLLEQW